MTNNKLDMIRQFVLFSQKYSIFILPFNFVLWMIACLFSFSIRVYHRVSSCIIVYHRVPSCIIVYHRVASCIIVYHRVPSCIIVYHRVSSCTIVYHRVSSCTIVYLIRVYEGYTHRQHIMDTYDHSTSNYVPFITQSNMFRPFYDIFSFTIFVYLKH
jgi:hypothetical protein